MIVVRIWEGLGNQMFQYAYARLLSQMGFSVCLDLDKAYDEFFDRDRRQKSREVAIHNFNIALKSIDVKRTKKYGYLKRKTLLDKLIFELSRDGKWFYNFWDESYAKETWSIQGNCYVKGWFQNPLYFNEIRGMLLKEFTPKKKIKISSQLKTMLQRRQTVSVHIRRTDYVSIHCALKWDYYEKALSMIKAYYQNPIFIVFSDDYEWAKQHMPLDEDCYYIDENECLEDYEQLLVMSCCKSNIIANSTFSWWAAWLNRNPDKNVIMPSKWLKGQEKLIMKEWNVI